MNKGGWIKGERRIIGNRIVEIVEDNNNVVKCVGYINHVGKEVYYD